METFINTLITLGTSIAFLILLYLLSFLIKWLFGDRIEVEINSQSIRISVNKNLVTSARIAYVEISGRKIAQEFEEKYDAISEIYNSYYNSFVILRELKKNLSFSGNEGKLYHYIDSFSKNVMRPHLTKYQSKYRTWLDKKRKEASFVDENTAQKEYLNYLDIINDIRKINRKAQEVIILIGRIAYRRKKNG